MPWYGRRSGGESGPAGHECCDREEQYQAALAAVTAPEFRTAAARTKQEALWSFISRRPYDQLPSMHSTNMQLMRKLMSRAFLRRAFVQDDDVRPPRTKAFHAFGAAAKMRFVADGIHPFTGIFATGGVGFMRASLAVGMPNYSPATAFKFLLDGPHPSENMLLHQSLDMQASRDFFERAPTNHTLTPTTFPNTLMLPLLRFWLSRISSPIELQPLDHLAAVTDNGTVVERAIAPELVYSLRADEVRNDPASTEDFRSLLATSRPARFSTGCTARRRAAPRKSTSVPSPRSRRSSHRNSGTASWLSSTPGETTAAPGSYRHDCRKGTCIMTVSEDSENGLTMTAIAQRRAQAVPLTVLTGFLGAGKTTC